MVSLRHGSTVTLDIGSVNGGCMGRYRQAQKSVQRPWLATPVHPVYLGQVNIAEVFGIAYC